MSAVLSRPSGQLPSLQRATLRVGTRGSPLALAQARMVMRAIGARLPDRIVREEVVATTGDHVQDRRLAALGGKGLFAKEIHEAMLDGRIDLAVHSLKDLETELPSGIAIACVLPREDARDALILAPELAPVQRAIPFPMLPLGARIGTASARRQAQLLHARSDLRIGLIRGNVGTRLARLEGGDFAGTLLALAGLNRLGLSPRADVVLEPEIMLPAAGQGILAVTARARDRRMLELLAMLDDPAARLAAHAERAVLRALDGTCHTPIGAHARLIGGGEMLLTAMIARLDGSFLLRRSLIGAAHDAERLGAELGAALRADSPADILA